ncbi:PIG-L family deacetylase [Erythrobacter sp. 3-20A1M]|uniref:PIG-L deacetylase family protein n=1 Tax=Erythrobacter sp. 3-20A1M TaxID=2653850 RepID=UPI001BFCB010|nr:PIG-L family deacetylase [Erythrobacter sp. 3-20A1M]QWC57280.1 PIG-L family deacetylase [Erythrobacter sp. 3-20A1M]
MSVPATAEGALLRHAANASRVDIARLAPPGALLVVVPHPDDETFGCGMALAAAGDSRRRIVVALLTDGEGSHPTSRLFPRDSLVDLRAREFAEALRILVPDQQVSVERLHLPDGSSRIDTGTLDSLTALARQHDVRAIWATWALDPHCDHEVAGDLAAEVARRLDIPSWSFPVWGRFGERGLPERMVTFADPDMNMRKRAAMAVYASQTTALIDDDPNGFIMPPALLDHFATHPEIFIRG